MNAYESIHAACTVAYLDNADTAIRNALEDGEDIVLTQRESKILKDAIEAIGPIMARLLDAVNDYSFSQSGETKESYESSHIQEGNRGLC